MPALEKITVLIVDDIDETRDNIRRLLQFDPNIDVIGAAKNGQEAIDLSQQIKPDVVIMDINMPDIDGITATEIIRKKVPHTQVVILSVQSDPSYMRRAMLAGARDFLTKPPSIDDLTGAVHRAGKMAQEERAKAAQAFPGGAIGGGQVSAAVAPTLGKIIVVYSPKGGTGCTTIATNLALAMHSEDRRVVLVDASLQFGDVAVFLNEQVKNNILDLAPRVDELDPEVVESVTIRHAASGIRLVAAPPRPEMSDKVSSEQFTKLLQYLQRLFSYVIVDTCCYLTDVVQSALETADLIILITTQDIPSIKNCNSFLSLADASSIRRRIFFTMNRYDKRIAITPERVGESLRQEILITIPLDEKIVSSAVNRGIPFMIDNKTSLPGKAIYQLADAIRERLSKAEIEGETQAKK